MKDYHREALEYFADEADMSPDQAQAMLDNVGLDVTELSEDHATELVEAWEADDLDRVVEILEENDVDQQFIDMLIPDSGGNSGGDDARPASDSGGASSGGLSENEIRSVVQDEMNEVLGPLKNQLQSMSQSGGQADSQGQGLTAQQQIAAQLAQSFMQQQAGGGAAAELGQQFQKVALSKMVKDMNKPDIGDLLERKYYEKVLGSEAVDDIYSGLMPDDDGQLPGVDLAEIGLDVEDDDDE
jgi:hypothetical protein